MLALSPNSRWSTFIQAASLEKQFRDGFGEVKSTYTILARTVFQRSFVAFDSILLIRTIAWEMTKMNADKICGLATFSPFLTPSICRCLMKLCS